MTFITTVVNLFGARMKKAEVAIWRGRPFIAWTAPIRDLQRKIPNFKSSDFHVGEAINKYLNLISRDPLDEFDLKPDAGNFIDESDALNHLRMPVDAVRKEHKGFSRGGQEVLGGYKLIQHHQVLNDVLETLQEFSFRKGQDLSFENSRCRITPLRNPNTLDGKLRRSIYGARMRIEFLVPNYQFYPDNEGPFILKVTCENSTDRSIALKVLLTLHRTGSVVIPISRFKRNHDQGLSDWAIRDFLNCEFSYFSNGTWRRWSVSKEEADNLIDELCKKEFKDYANQILSLYEQLIEAIEEAGSFLRSKKGELNVFQFRQVLGSLFEHEFNLLSDLEHEKNLLFLQEQRMVQILDRIEKLLNPKHKK